MTNSPLDTTTREMIGRVFFILSLTADPASVIRYTSSIISLVLGALHKIGITKYDQDIADCRVNWKAAKNRYVSGRHGWVACEDILSDINDFLYDIAMENDIIIIKAEWYNLSANPTPTMGSAESALLEHLEDLR